MGFCWQLLKKIYSSLENGSMKRTNQLDIVAFSLVIKKL
jgi:hypothetical protein